MERNTKSFKYKVDHFQAVTHLIRLPSDTVFGHTAHYRQLNLLIFSFIHHINNLLMCVGLKSDRVCFP